MDNNNGFNGEQPDMNSMFSQPVQPDANNMYGQPAQPVQPDMNSMYGQPAQPVQPDMNSMYGQPAQPQQDFSGMFSQPVQPDMNTMFSQPVQPDANNMYGQPPVGPGMGALDGKKVKKPKKPMTKGKIAGLIAGGIAIVAAVVCGVIFLPKIFKSDKEVVLDALEETFSSYSSESELFDQVGLEDIQKAVNQKGGKSQVSYNFVMEDEFYSLDVGCDMDATMNKKEKKLDTKATVTISGAELLSFDFYADENNTYISLPEIIDGYISLPNDDPFGAIANSELGQMMELDTAALAAVSLDYFGGASGQLSSSYVDAFETVWDAAKFEKQGKAKISVNGESVKATEYTVTWTKKDLQDACCSVIDGMTDAVVNSGAALEESGTSVEDFKTSMEQVKAMIPTIINSDLQIKVYVKGKRAVKVVCKDSVNLMGFVSIDYDFWFDAGENDVTADFSIVAAGSKVGINYEAHDVKGNTNGTISAYVGEEKISADFSKDVVKSGDTTTTTYKLQAGEYVKLEAVSNVYGDNTFDCNATVDVMGVDGITIAWNGALRDVKKGVAYTLAIDSFEVKMAGQKLCSGSLTSTVDTSDITVTGLDSNAKIYEVVSMTMSDWEKFVEDNTDKINAWLERLENEEAFQDLAGMFDQGFDDTDIMDDDDMDDMDDVTATDGDASADEEETVLEAADGTRYNIKDCIEGFTFWYGSETSVEFETDNYSYLNYSLCNADSMQEVLDLVFFSAENLDDVTIEEQSLNQTTQIDGKDVLYNVEKYVSYGMNVLDICGVTEVEPGIFMVINASIYVDDDDYTVEDVLEAFSSTYYEKVQ